MCLQNYTIKLFQGNLNNLSVCSEFYKNRNEPKHTIGCQCTCVNEKVQNSNGEGEIIDNAIYYLRQYNFDSGI